jgi:L-ascorbate metabolism protein UlaG (beta-lactamase superfamily)
MFTPPKQKILLLVVGFIGIAVLLGMVFLQDPAFMTAPSTVTSTPDPTSTPKFTPTITPTTAPVVTPIDPSIMQITYVCNDGFIIVAGGKKILIDALFRDTNDICKIDPPGDVAGLSQAPFDHADLVLISHSHWDHFDPQIVGNYLVANPEAIVIAEKSAADALREEFSSFDLVGDRVQSVELSRGESSRLNPAHISLELIGMPADVRNVAFLFRLGEFTFFHSGDANFDEEIFSDLQGIGLPARGINFAFVPYWYMTDSTSRTLLEEGLDADHTIPMHYAGEGGEGLFNVISKVFPQAIIFHEELQTWSGSARVP